MAEILARFADGRLLVKEEKLVTEGYKISSAIGVPFQIGLVQTIEHVLSIDAHVSGRPGLDGHIATSLKEVKVHSSKLDTLLITMRRADTGIPVMTGVLSAVFASGTALEDGDSLLVSGSVALTGPIWSGTKGQSYLSGVTSGLGYGAELLSGYAISNYVNVVVNVIGY